MCVRWCCQCVSSPPPRPDAMAWAARRALPQAPPKLGKNSLRGTALAFARACGAGGSAASRSPVWADTVRTQPARGMGVSNARVSSARRRPSARSRGGGGASAAQERGSADTQCPGAVAGAPGAAWRMGGGAACCRRLLVSCDVPLCAPDPRRAPAARRNTHLFARSSISSASTTAREVRGSARGGRPGVYQRPQATRDGQPAQHTHTPNTPSACLGRSAGAPTAPARAIIPNGRQPAGSTNNRSLQLRLRTAAAVVLQAGWRAAACPSLCALCAADGPPALRCTQNAPQERFLLPPVRRFARDGSSLDSQRVTRSSRPHTLPLPLRWPLQRKILLN